MKKYDRVDIEKYVHFSTLSESIQMKIKELYNIDVKNER